MSFAMKSSPSGLLFSFDALLFRPGSQPQQPSGHTPPGIGEMRLPVRTRRIDRRYVTFPDHPRPDRSAASKYLIIFRIRTLLFFHVDLMWPPYFLPNPRTNLSGPYRSFIPGFATPASALLTRFTYSQSFCFRTRRCSLAPNPFLSHREPVCRPGNGGDGFQLLRA